MKEKLLNIYRKYNHGLAVLYFCIYMPWFLYLEHRPSTHAYLIHSPLDDLIPFEEVFIIPYLLWFAFIGVVGLYLFFESREGFLKYAAYLITGMTIFLVISTIFPNELDLRPAIFPRQNIFTDLVRMIYRNDTPTNVFPSIHVYNSLGAAFAIAHDKVLNKHKVISGCGYVLTGLIILSTMFLKQHSVTDVCGAALMSLIVYSFIYTAQTRKATTLSHQPI